VMTLTHKPGTQKDSGDFSVELVIPSDMEMIPLVVNLGTALMELRGYGQEDQDVIRLAIHETLINSIQYGSNNASDSRITIRFYFQKSQFHTDIEDEGDGFDPEILKDPTKPENLLKPGGRGIFLVKHLTETVSAQSFPEQVPLPPWPRVTVSELFKKHLDIILDGSENADRLREKAKLAGFYESKAEFNPASKLTESLDYEQMFFKLWNHFEADLGIVSPIFVYS